MFVLDKNQLVVLNGFLELPESLISKVSVNCTSISCSGLCHILPICWEGGYLLNNNKPFLKQLVCYLLCIIFLLCK